MRAGAIPSPCVNLCQMDDDSGWCFGCGRTIDEIVRWGSTDAGDREAVMAELQERLAVLSRADDL